MAKWPWQRPAKTPATPPPESTWQHLQSIQQIQAGQDQVEPAPVTQLAKEHAQLYPKPSPLHQRGVPPISHNKPSAPASSNLLLQKMTRTLIAFWRGKSR